MGSLELIEVVLILATCIQAGVIYLHWRIARLTGWVRAMTIYCFVYATMVTPRVISQLVLYDFIAQETARPINVLVFLFDSIGLGIAGYLFLGLLKRQTEQLQLATEREIGTEAAQDIIIHMDEKGTVLYVNEAITRMLGFKKDQLEGKSIQTIMPTRYREAHQKGLANYIATGKKSLDWSAIKMSALTAWGHDTEVPIELSFGEFFVKGEKRFVGVIRRLD